MKPDAVIFSLPRALPWAKSRRVEEPVRERFARVAAGPEENIDLAEAALLIAAEEYPRLDVGRYIARLDQLADQARAACAAAATDAERVDRLNHFLFVTQRFAGNQKQYYDRRNSFLNEVIDRRKGIPITLSLVYMEVARRLGFTVYGVSFPGHFLAKYVGHTEIVIDAFVGQTLTEDECRRRLRATMGPRATFGPALLRPAGPKEILTRMLRNLKQIDVQQRQFARALRHCERILMLNPSDPTELRDRGLVYQQLECFGPALSDLERFLALAPDDDTVETVRESVIAILRQSIH